MASMVPWYRPDRSVVFAGSILRGRVIEHQRATHADGLVRRLLDAETPQVLTIVKEMAEYRRWVDPLLRDELSKASDPRQKLHVSLALLPYDPSQVNYLLTRLSRATSTELPVVLIALREDRTSLAPKLWEVLESAKPGDATLLPTASALAIYEPGNARWASVVGKLAQTMVSTNPVNLGPWLDALRPVGGKLNQSLAMIFKDTNLPETERALATNILTDYASEDPNLIADLLMDSDPRAYAAFFPIARSLEAETLPLFQAELERQSNDTR